MIHERISNMIVPGFDKKSIRLIGILILTVVFDIQLFQYGFKVSVLSMADKDISEYFSCREPKVLIRCYPTNSTIASLYNLMNYPFVLGKPHCLGSVGYSQFHKHVIQVAFYRIDRDMQLQRDFTIRTALRRQP